MGDLRSPRGGGEGKDKGVTYARLGREGDG